MKKPQKQSLKPIYVEIIATVDRSQVVKLAELEGLFWRNMAKTVNIPMAMELGRTRAEPDNQNFW